MFTPITGFFGAGIIQAATTSYLNLEGKVVGFSSAITGAIRRPNANNVGIMLGMFLSSQLVKFLLPQAALVSNPLGHGWLTWAISGLLVGLGTSAGCGCTSGHMLSGLSRLRWRSFIATCCFFSSGVVTNWLMGNASVLPSFGLDLNLKSSNVAIAGGMALLSLIWSYLVLPKIAKSVQKKSVVNARFLTATSTGLQFGLGLFVAGMTDAGKVAGFLSFTTPDRFDPSLVMIPLVTILPNVFVWQKLSPPTVSRPVLESTFDLNWSDLTEPKFILGNLLFGVGWGMCGVCPGPGLLGFFLNGPFSLQGLWLASFLAGSFTEKALQC